MEFKREEAAVRALKELNRRAVGGTRINVQWSKRSGKFAPDERAARRRREKSPPRPTAPPRTFPDYDALDSLSYELPYEAEELRALERLGEKARGKRVKAR